MADAPVLDSHTLFPEMMQSTRLLVLDHDVFRYHSFDLFRKLLTDTMLFKDCESEMRNLVLHQEITQQIYRYERGCYYLNPYECFPSRKGMKLEEYEKNLNEYLKDMKITPTDLGSRFGIVFDRRNMTGYILRYTNDPFILPFADSVKIYTSHSVLDLRMATAIIQKHNINAVMLCNVDLAVLLAAKLMVAGITRQITFIIGSYAYNLDPQTNMLRLVPEMLAFERKLKHEFGMYEPYTGLRFQNKEVHE